MSFGGSVSAMMQTIKENRNLLRNKNKKFRSNNINGIYSKEKGNVLKFKEVSKQELIRIKEKNKLKIKNTEQRLLLKVIAFILLGIFLLIYMLK